MVMDRKVGTILKTLYKSVTILKEWIRSADTEGLLESSLFTEADSPGYKHLLETTLVAVKADSRPLATPFSFTQDSYQYEVVIRCIQKVFKRDGIGNNVLSFGFGPLTDNPRALMCSALDIEYRHPNTSVTRLHYKVWKTLLNRIGDTLMSHLLTNTSVFIMLVKPAVYLQLTGTPIFQMCRYSSTMTKNTTVESGSAHCHSSQDVTTFSLKPRRNSKTLYSKHTKKHKRKASGDGEFVDLPACKKRKLCVDAGTSSEPHPLGAQEIVLPSTSCEHPVLSPSGSLLLSSRGSGEREEQPESTPKSKRQRKRMRQKKNKQKQTTWSPGSNAYQYHWYVPRLSLLYGKCLREKFPDSFSLGGFSPTEEGAKMLFRDIFVQEPSTTPVFQTRVLPLLKELLLNHRKGRYFTLLKRHCPSIFDKQKGLSHQETYHDSYTGHHSTPEGGKEKTCHKICGIRVNTAVKTNQLLEDHVSHQKVFSFLCNVLRQTVPSELMGSHNRAVFFKNIKSLVYSGKFEKICLGQLMQRMKLNACEWLREVTCQAERQRRMAEVVRWVMVHFILPVIKTCFHVTDTTTYRNRIFYYRKKTWLRLQARAMRDFKKDCNLHAMSKSRVNEWLDSGQALGVSEPRFLPKIKSLRPIVNMSRPGPDKPSINQQLRKLFQALSFEKKLDASVCGCSAFGIDDVYTKLREFKEKRTSSSDNRCLYLVKSDISNCFNSIDQKLLHSIVRDILTKNVEQTYMTRKFASVHAVGKRMKRTFYSDTTRLSLFQPDFPTFVRQQGARWNDILLVDTGFYHQDSTESLLRVLESHLFKNVIKVGGKYYLQTTGISQGSVMSTLLASIYLAHLEKSHLSIREDELLLRRMDDYLFITPDKAQAQNFLDTMLNGFPEYNCFTNAKKILTNFPVSVDAVHCIRQEALFRWCGLMINTCSLEVSVDYSRYSGLHIIDTATFDTSFRAGQTLSNKLLMCLKIKCHAIFLDSVLNSKERILVNVYQALLFVARTFHSFVMKLPASKRVESNPGFFCRLVRMLPKYIQNLMTRKIGQNRSVDQFPISLHLLQWISADAFLEKLHRYPGYMSLKKLLRAGRMSYQRKLRPEDLTMLRDVRHTAVQLDRDIILF